jgi:probable phosphoglycerate mutase
MVYSSPLKRARLTARLAGFPEPAVTPLLMEWDYGDYEGVTTHEIREKRPDWDLWRDGCPGGESPEQVLGRARAFIAEALRRPGNVIAFSHGHFLRAIAIAFLDLQAAAGNRLGLDTAALSILRAGERGHLLELWNDTGHLPG